MGDEDRYMGIAELVAYSSLSERSIRRHLADKDHPIPSYRVDGRVLVKRSEFDAWIRERGGVKRTADDDEKTRIVAAIVAGARR